jgi:G3E family GTPase
MSHILSNYDGLKVAVLVNDMGEINIDAALVKKRSVSFHQREEHIIELSNGCICCTLREDLLVEVAQIASQGTFDYMLIESTGVSEPMPVAETFTFEDSNGHRLGDIAQLDTLVTVVDGSHFLSELESLQSLRERNWHTDPKDQRTISHLLCDQVEFANVVVVNKCDLMKEHEIHMVKLLIKNMNPTAVLIESTYSAVPLEKVLGTGLFSMSEAEKYEGWLKEARVGDHTPETIEYGITSFTYRALKPFWPHKLKYVLDAMINKMAPFDSSSEILRAKGFTWLASFPQVQGDFSFAGHHLYMYPGHPWWAEIDKEHWPETLERDLEPIWHEPFGDRQQEIVIIGQSLDEAAISLAFDECLLSDEEITLDQETWKQMCMDAGDPFESDWDVALEVAQHKGHDHGHHHSRHGDKVERNQHKVEK